MAFIQTPLFDYLLEQELKYPDARFNRAFALKQDLTPYFIPDMRYRLIKPKKTEKIKRPQRNLNIEVFSQATSGSAKTTCSCSIAIFGSALNNLSFTVKNNVPTMNPNKELNINGVIVV